MRIQPQSSTPPRADEPLINFDADGTKIRVLGQQMGCSVHQLDDEYVLKAGDRVKPSEAAAMVLVQQQTDVPIPSLINSEFDSKLEQGWLWMSIIPGRTLDLVWEKLNDATKRRLCSTIWTMIAKIREIKRPTKCKGLFQCAADGSTTDDPLLKDLRKTPIPILHDNALRARIYERYMFYAGRRYAKELPDMLPRSSASVFTHADISPRNIMVDGNFRITGIIDWEAAGWYPDYWEYANIMRPACWCGDWQDWMDRTAPPQFKCNLEGINAARRVLF